MKLSELYTQLKIEGFGEYVARLEQAKRANQDFTTASTQNSIRAGQGLRESIDALRRVSSGGFKPDNWSPYLQPAVKSLRDYREAARMAAGGSDDFGERLFRLQTSGRLIAMLLGSELPAGSARAISALMLTSNAVTVLTNNMRLLQGAARMGMYAAAGAGGYALGSWGAKQIFESQTGTKWEESSNEALSASGRNQRQLLTAGAMRQRGYEREALDYGRKAEIEILRLEMNGLEVGSQKIAELKEAILLKERDLELTKTGNLEHQKTIRNLYDARIEAMKTEEAKAEARRREAEAEAWNRPGREFDKSLGGMMRRMGEMGMGPAERARQPFQAMREQMNEMVKDLLENTLLLNPRYKGSGERISAIENFYKELNAKESEAMNRFGERGRIGGEIEERRRELAGMRAPAGQDVIRGGMSDIMGFVNAIQAAAASQKTDYENKMLAYEERKAKLLEEIKSLEEQASVLSE